MYPKRSADNLKNMGRCSNSSFTGFSVCGVFTLKISVDVVFLKWSNSTTLGADTPKN